MQTDPIETAWAAGEAAFKSIAGPAMAAYVAAYDPVRNAFDLATAPFHAAYRDAIACNADPAAVHAARVALWISRAPVERALEDSFRPIIEAYNAEIDRASAAYDAAFKAALPTAVNESRERR